MSSTRIELVEQLRTRNAEIEKQLTEDPLELERLENERKIEGLLNEEKLEHIRKAREEMRKREAQDAKEARIRIKRTHRDINRLVIALWNLRDVIDLDDTFLGVGKHMSEYIRSAYNKKLSLVDHCSGTDEYGEEYTSEYAVLDFSKK